eukprot:351348-Chlamydomonas_euryale.AAC.2
MPARMPAGKRTHSATGYRAARQQLQGDQLPSGKCGVRIVDSGKAGHRQGGGLGTGKGQLPVWSTAGNLGIGKGKGLPSACVAAACVVPHQRCRGIAEAAALYAFGLGYAVHPWMEGNRALSCQVAQAECCCTTAAGLHTGTSKEYMNRIKIVSTRGSIHKRSLLEVPLNCDSSLKRGSQAGGMRHYVCVCTQHKLAGACLTVST